MISFKLFKDKETKSAVLLIYTGGTIGMKEDPETAIRRIGQLFDGNIVMSLKRSAGMMK